MFQEREKGRGPQNVGDEREPGLADAALPSSNTRFTNVGSIPPVQTEATAATRTPTASERAYGSFVPPSGDGKRAQRVGETGTSPTDETPNKRVDPKLVIDTPWLRFPATAVGTSSSAEVSVRNPDEAAHTLDPAVPIGADPFQDFKIRQNSNVVLPPGESRTVKVDFTPSRHGAVEESFQLGTDRGWGPMGELQVAGAGREVNSSTSEDEIAIQEKGRHADQDFQREHIEATRATDPNRAKRIAAGHAIDSWKSRALQFNASLADWTHANWEHFLGKTGGDVHVTEPGRIAKFLKSKVVKGATKLATAPLKGEEPTGFVRKQVDKGVEWAVGKFGDWLWDQMSDEKKVSPDEAALEATNHVADQSIAKGKDISRARSAANLVVEDSESAARLHVAKATDAAELEAWTSWGYNELANVPKDLDATDFSLADELLATWTQERAVTPTKANQATNSKAWDAARADLKKSGKLASLEKTDLFEHQCRYAWSRLGMPSDDIDSALAELDARRREIEDRARAIGVTDPSEIAQTVATELGAPGYNPIVAIFRRSENPEATRAAFAPYNRDFEAGGRFEHYFVGSGFNLTCRLQLKSDGGAVYVDKFAYRETYRGDYYLEP